MHSEAYTLHYPKLYISNLRAHNIIFKESKNIMKGSKFKNVKS